jgi:peptidoglycan/LPS O-acetylase OafA/YrhL
MIQYQYIYLTINIILLPIWIMLFLRKDTRKEMLVISLIAGILGIFAEIIYTKDWWNPITITGGAIGVETFLFGFLISGISSVIYMVFFREKLKKTKPLKKNLKKALLIIILGCAIFFGGYYLFRLNSFIATLLSFGVLTIIILFKRRDLIKNSIISGLMISFLGLIIYAFLKILFPEWIDETLYFKNIPRIIVLNLIPLEDLIWFFVAGCFLGPVYEYWTEQVK